LEDRGRGTLPCSWGVDGAVTERGGDEGGAPLGNIRRGKELWGGVWGTAAPLSSAAVLKGTAIRLVKLGRSGWMSS